MGECLSSWGAKVRNLQQSPLFARFAVLSVALDGEGRSALLTLSLSAVPRGAKRSYRERTRALGMNVPITYVR